MTAEEEKKVDHPSPSSPNIPTEYRILALYRFVSLVSPNHTIIMDDDEGTSKNNNWDKAALMAHPEQHPTLRKLQSELLATLRRYDAKGTLLLAPEGINGTVCYPFPPPAAVEENGVVVVKDDGDGDDDNDTINFETDDNDPVANYLKNHPQFGGPKLRTRSSVWKDERHETISNSGELLKEPLSLNNKPQQAFHRLKIKIKAEIVTLGLGRPLVDRKPAAERIVAVDAVHNNDGDEAVVEGQLADGRIANNADETIAKNDHDTATTTSANHNAAQTTAATQNNNQSTTTTDDRHASNQLANPLSTKGQYLSPAQWDEACRNPNVLVIDTRNAYEIDIGTFESAVDPATSNFSEFPEYLERLAEEYDWSRGGGDGGSTDALATTTIHNGIDTGQSNGDSSNTNNPDNDGRKKKPPPQGIAMFCTGGIRCEKATSYAMQSNLFPKDLPIYHLEGGILAYLDDVAKRDDDPGPTSSEANGNGNLQQIEGNGELPKQPPSSKSTFHGECFVFDKRVALKEGLKPSSTYTSCHGCRGPIDRRLLVRSTNNAITNDRNNNHDNDHVNKYNKLIKGIGNLPPLQLDDKTRKYYLPGLTCPRCHATTTRESLERFAQRERQMEICVRDGKSLFQDQGGGGG